MAYASSALPTDFLSGPPPNLLHVKHINFAETRLEEYDGLYAVVIDNALSADECATLVHAAEARTNGTWEPAMVNRGDGTQQLATCVRNCGRTLWDDSSVVEKIWSRVKGAVPELEILKEWPEVTGPASVLKKEKWKVVGLNERMRFLKYGAGHYFRRKSCH